MGYNSNRKYYNLNYDDIITNRLTTNTISITRSRRPEVSLKITALKYGNVSKKTTWCRSNPPEVFLGKIDNMLQIYRKTPIPQCDFNKDAKQFYWSRTSAWVFSPVNLQHIFRTLFPKIISGALLLVVDFTSSEGLGQHCVKSVRIRSYSGPYLSVFCPNAGTYGPNNSEYGHFLRSADM